MAVAKKTASKPVSVEVRFYNVGLGDCILLTFKSKAGQKTEESRVLIDFGSTGRNAKDGPNQLQIAEQIVSDCGGKNATLEAIIVTHRHKDHMSGFGGRAGKVLSSQLRPKVIIRPWTEEPGAENPPTATTDPSELSAARHVRSLGDAQKVTDSILNEILARRERGMGRATDDEAIFYSQKNLPFGEGKTQRKVDGSNGDSGHNDELLEGLNLESIANADALLTLQNWSWKVGGKTVKPKHKYLQKGSRLSLPIPGLTTSVLGPVGPKHWENLKKHADTDELWKRLQALRMESDSPDLPIEQSDYVEFKAEEGVYGVPSVFEDDYVVPDDDMRKDSVRWLVNKLDTLRGEQLLRFVRVLDEHINNTSLVLLMDFGGFRMLFPGDAEVAAWQAIRDDDKTEAKLKDIDLYKVGHHGSNNATPKKSLWETLIEDRDETRPLHCLLSTQTTKFKGSIPNAELLSTMLNSDHFHLVSTAYPDSVLPSEHTVDWSVDEQGSGSKRLVMSYFREFEL